MPTNNVTRMLDGLKIPYTAFKLPAEKFGAIETARQLGVPQEMVFKTIVVKRDKPGKPLLVVIPGNHEVDLKTLAAFLGEKKVLLPTQREAETLTSLQAGGISPLALINKGFLVIIDQSASQFEQIHISGGQRGLSLRLPVAALIEICHARVTQVSKRMEDSGAAAE